MRPPFIRWSFVLFVLYLMLCAVGVDDIGILKLSYQAGLDGVNVDSAQFVPLYSFLLGQTLGFCFLGQLVDSGDNFIHIHIYTSNIAVDDHGNASFFRLAVDGSKLYFSKAPQRNPCAHCYRFIRLLTGETVNGGFACGDILSR